MLPWLGPAIREAAKWLNVYGRLRECDNDRAELHKQILEMKLIQAEQGERLVSYQKVGRIGTLRVDSDGRIIEAGPEFADMCGYTMAELVGLPLIELIPSRHRYQHDKMSKEVFAGQRQARTSPLETELRCKDGRELQVMISLSTMNVGSGTVVRADVKRRQ